MLTARNKHYSLEYWLKDVLLNSKIFSAAMATDRFIPILRMLYFSCNEEQTEGHRLQNVYVIFNKFLPVFHDSFIPSQDLC
jgi:hypothetical protein